MNKKYSLLTQSIACRFCISKLRERENEKLGLLQSELVSLESENPGVLCWRHRGEKITFWAYHKGKQHGITRDLQKIYSLARKSYLQLRFSDIRNHNMSKWTSEMEDLIQSFNSAGLDIMRIILTKAQYTWASNAQSQKTNRSEELRYRTNGGILVRSKSEQFIGNLLEEFGIPFRYEPEMRIGNRIFHPDFVIMTTDGRKIILEHFGRMDLKEYVYAAIDRLIAYNSHNLLLGHDVFVSFERDVRSRDSFIPIIYQIMAA